MAHDPPGMARIIEAAIECFGATGVAGTSLKVIAQRAGTSQALIVHHFGSKQNLAQRCTADVLARAESEARRTPDEAVEQIAGRVADVRFLARVLTDDEGMSRTLFASAVERAAAARPDVDADEAVVLAVLNLAPLLLGDRISETLQGDTWGRFTRAASRLLKTGQEA